MNNDIPPENNSERASSLEDIFKIIKEYKYDLRKEASKLGLNNSDSSEAIWYRGVPRSEFKLIPSLLRFEDGLKHERDLYEGFLEHNAPDKRDWDALFEMQHYFIPTRLLDWSPSFGVALHFAIHGDVPRDTPTIWVLHPGILNKNSLPDRFYKVF